MNLYLPHLAPSLARGRAGEGETRHQVGTFRIDKLK